MARNIVIRQSPAWPVTSCAAAHTSGDLVVEDSVVGVAVETNLISTPNTLIQHGVVEVVCPSGVTEGQPLYFPTASLTAGATVQAAPSAVSNVTATLQTSATSATLIGRARVAAYALGLSTVTKLELAAVPRAAAGAA